MRLVWTRAKAVVDALHNIGRRMFLEQLLLAPADYATIWFVCLYGR